MSTPGTVALSSNLVDRLKYNDLLFYEREGKEKEGMYLLVRENSPEKLVCDVVTPDHDQRAFVATGSEKVEIVKRQPGGEMTLLNRYDESQLKTEKGDLPLSGCDKIYNEEFARIMRGCALLQPGERFVVEAGIVAASPIIAETHNYVGSPSIAVSKADPNYFILYGANNQSKIIIDQGPLALIVDKLSNPMIL